jgi:hypothetical protein
MRRRVVLIASGLVIVLAALLALPPVRDALTHLGQHRAAATGAKPTPSSSPSHHGVPQTVIQSAPAGPRMAVPADAANITGPGTSMFEWAFLDRQTGVVTGSKGYAVKTNTIESMIKPGIVGDWLRRQAEAGQQPTQAQLDEITRTIIDSVDTLAQKYYNLGGGVSVINRLKSICGLTDVVMDPQGRWSWMKFTPRDSLRYGQCIGDGRVAGPTWTPFLLSIMRNVRGTLSSTPSHDGEGGRWGIIDGLPPELAKDTSIKNGWTPYIADGWHVNCMAIHPNFVLVIEIHSPSLPNAADVCRKTAARFVVNPAP